MLQHRDRRIVQDLVLHRHQVEAAEMRAEQHAAFAGSQGFVDEVVADHLNLEAIEFAARDLDAVGQGRRR